MSDFPVDSIPREAYNALDIDGYGDHAIDYVGEVENRVKELRTLLKCCDWQDDERRALARELRELEVTRYEIKILGVV